MPTNQIRGNRQIMAGTIEDAQVAAGAAIATTKLAEGADFLQRDGSVALTANLPAGGFKITGHGTPTANGEVATYDWVLSQIAGIQSGGAEARVATTANITLSGTQTVDGVALSAGNKVWVRAQTAAADNGLYDVAAGSLLVFQRVEQFRTNS